MNKLPFLNAQDALKLRKLIEGGELIPLLNNTKWSELISEMINAPEMNPQFRTRSVFAPPDYVTDWDGEWFYHIHPVAEIEWIDLQSNSNDWLLATLKMHNIPCSSEQGTLRVWGYTRRGMQPCWL
jgi:hypothetical protein